MLHMLTIIGARLTLKVTPELATRNILCICKKDTELVLSNKSDHLSVVGSRRYGFFFSSLAKQPKFLVWQMEMVTLDTTIDSMI